MDMALGGDQGGSIRIPSSNCGIVGLKVSKNSSIYPRFTITVWFQPTFGLVPYTGIFSIEPTLDIVGPMARTVEDVALLLEVFGFI